MRYKENPQREFRFTDMSIIKKHSFFFYSNNVISIVKDSMPNYAGSMDRMN